MKTTITLICLCLLLSCSNSEERNTSNSAQLKLSSLKWMLGDWIRTNEVEGKETHEHWEKVSKKEYKGFGYTLNEKGDTVFQEQLRILHMKGVWSYEVSGVNEKPTYFGITSNSKNGFTCENQNNPFPKKIEYKYENNIMIANISGGNDQIEFVFKKIN